VNLLKPLIVSLTGASGISYGVRLVDALLELEHEVILITSEHGELVAKIEMDMDLKVYMHKEGITSFNEENIAASVASGSFLTAGMVVCPCSAKTLALIANGLEMNLIARAASVTLKEGRKLVLVPRETPLSLPIIENFHKAFLAGAVILPAMPGFYHKPTSIKELEDFIVGKILDQFGIEHNLYRRWGERGGKNERY